MTDQDEKRDGHEHPCLPAILCQHLAKPATDLGFHRGLDPDNLDALWPLAWCDDCEDVRSGGGEWNDHAMDRAGFQLVCEQHYDEVRRTHWSQDERAYEELAQRAIAYLQQCQDEVNGRFPLDNHEQYSWNMDTRELVISTGGKPQFVADFRFAGSFCRQSESWMWAWANPSIDEPMKNEIRQVRSYGEEHSYRQLVSGLSFGPEEDAWEMTAIAAYLLRARGAFRSPDEKTVSFLLIQSMSRVE